ncbi:MAG: NAD+ synthase [Bacteroidota bacterium]
METARHIDADLKINPRIVRDILVRFIRWEVERAGFKKAVVGISGGVDSALAAFLAVEAIGNNNVRGVLLPYKTSSVDSRDDALTVVEKLSIPYESVDITPMADAYFAMMDSMDNVRRGNVLARLRMIVLYDLSARERALVIGTSNKTELLLGYGTLYGDMASAINPIGDLYKTQVWQLASFMGVPQKIVEKPPTADLWVGQTDEGELGISYPEVDRLLFHLVDERRSKEELIELGFSAELIERVEQMVVRSQFKRRMPLIGKISHRTINVDFRYPRDWNT